jgi:hypothetical protein
VPLFLNLVIPFMLQLRHLFLQEIHRQLDVGGRVLSYFPFNGQIPFEADVLQSLQVVVKVHLPLS